jgi:folate-binding Fe-S cluster repair protein YgfZ
LSDIYPTSQPFFQNVVIFDPISRFPTFPDLGADQVESDNIVGYTTKSLEAGQKSITGAQFVEVGADGLDLASIKLVNVPAEGTAFIQWWNGSGYDRAAWVEIEYEAGADGWGDENTWEALPHTFAAGDGFWIVLPGGISGAQVIQSGEVAVSSATTYDFSLEAGQKSIVINPLPTELNLSDIALANVPAEGTAFIQWWNGAGYDRAAWVEIEYEAGADGWGDENTWEALPYTFAVGEGFWIVLPGGVDSPAVQIANTVL